MSLFLACDVCNTVELADWPDTRLPLDSPHAGHSGLLIDAVDISEAVDARSTFMGRSYRAA